MHTVKLGETFNLLDETWEVRIIWEKLFKAESSGHQYLWLSLEKADKLDWILPKNKVDEFVDFVLDELLPKDFMSVWKLEVKEKLKQKLIQLFGDV